MAHALSQYVGVVDKGRAPAAMTLVIPTLMARAAAEGEETYRETSARLLELAAVEQTVFRAIVNKMSSEQKAFLEEVIRYGRQSSSEAALSGTTEGGQPTIALKMNFGGGSHTT